ncbi:hypothetical protein Dvina_22950 [Dactylosporangium vinaceum]|uniref:Lipoprotein n=1 Tax=Dactylosporangium vinaceum TaxID=53362 RepID=A0ABV5MR15_9ACTN|nr:hypothetical protein [Dactylosporangium vinaceum]UAC00656.1 hypothetical protein Dvina_22950 [Dactylosporangium vinaceum]
MQRCGVFPVALAVLVVSGCGGSAAPPAPAPATAPKVSPPAAQRIPMTAGLSMVGVDAGGEPVQADETIAMGRPASWSRNLDITASPSYRHALARKNGRAVVVGLDGEVSTLADDIAPVPADTNLAFSLDERWLAWPVEGAGIKVAELVAGAARAHVVALPAEAGPAAKFAGWTPDNRLIVAGSDALYTVGADGRDARKVADAKLTGGDTGGGIQSIAHSYVQVNPVTGELAYSDTDPATKQPRLVVTDATFKPKRTVPKRSIAGFTADGKFYVARELGTAADARLACTWGTDACRRLPQSTLLTPWPNGLLPMQPAPGTEQITALVDPAGGQQSAPPDAFNAVATPHEVLPTALMQLLSKVAPTG